MTDFTKLKKYGWDEFFEKQTEGISNKNHSIGRVAIEHKNNYVLYSEYGELSSELSGKFQYNAEQSSDYPAVGDWVVFRPVIDEKKGVIEKILRRKNKFSRKEVSVKTEEQIIAANVDYLFIVTSLNLEINIRRIERYLILASESGVKPVLILSKSDLCEDPEKIISELKAIQFDFEIHMISVFDKTGIEELMVYFKGNKTVAVVGSSGVGKSTLINFLAGSKEMEVNETGSYKDRGRHTTSHRELVILKNEGIIIDTPGMRELQMWEGSEGISATFQDVEKYLGKCRFSDCVHKTEPGCAILKAIEDGEITEERFKSYLKLQSEIKYFENRNNKKAKSDEKKKWKKITSAVKKNKK